MKKRTVAILLSMIMCLAPAAEAGAASVGTEDVVAVDEGTFTSDEFTSEPEVIPLPEEQTGEETVPEENTTVEVIPEEEAPSDSE